jgi:hypothetical protein
MSVTFKCDNGDLILDTSGRFAVVSGLEKCSQDIAEALLNVWDPNGNNDYNGSELALIQGETAGLSTMRIEEQIRYAVQSAVERLMDAQSNDLYIDEDEQIEDIRELQVRKLGLFTYGFYLYCITLSEQDVPLAFSITLGQQLPASIDLVSLQSELMQSEPAVNMI